MPTVILRSMRRLVTGLAALASLGVVLSCGWFATMELVLRHPDYQWRFLVAAVIVVESALTFAMLEDLIPAAPLRWPLMAGAFATGVLGWWVVAEDLSRSELPASPHFEGYLLIIGLALIAYSLLMVVSMLAARPPISGPRPRGNMKNATV